MTSAADAVRRLGRAGGNDTLDRAVRFFAWANVLALGVFVFQIWAVLIAGAESPTRVFAGEAGASGWLMFLLYPAAFVAAAVLVLRTPLVGLREDADRLTDFNIFMIRAAFFAVLFTGVVDAVISFLRVEAFLEGIVGKPLSDQLGRPLFRGPYVHLPLIGLGIVVAFFARTLGFSWLALLIVAAELLIVISRFIFSYEQAFMGDLVRYWYAALFLFASAYTLFDEGHVRVDVLYAGMSQRSRGYVNAIGAVILGMALCWVILAIGAEGSASTIMAPLLRFEITQTGFGMYVKYLMAGFLGLFAITMLIQFAALLMEAVADIRGDPGSRHHEPASIA